MRAAVVLAALGLSVVGSSMSPNAAASARRATNIPPQDLGSALKTLELDRNRQVVFLAEDIKSLRTQGASGELTFDEALRQILNGTGLTFRFLDEKTVSILPEHSAKTTQTEGSMGRATKMASLSIFLAATASGMHQARAADDDPTASSGLQEVLVTATRREASLSKVPISITAMSQDAMDQRGIKDISDVARFTPGLKIDRTGTNNIAIRGISATGGASTTGIYIDDTPVQIRGLASNGVDALPQVFDIDRVEVLRGPQGTLFGAGSEGGTVRYITTQPSLTQSSLYSRSEISTAGGSANYEVGVAGGTPLIDGKLGVRLTAWTRHNGGWIDRINPTTLAIEDHNANSSSYTMLRLAAVWAINDSWTVTPGVYYQDQKGNDLSIYWSIYSDPDSGRYVQANPKQRQTPDRFYLPSLKIQGDLGPVTLISNTSYFNRKVTSSGYEGTVYDLGFFQTLIGIGEDGQFRAPFPLIDGNGIHLPPGLEDFRSPATVRDTQSNVTQEVRLQSADPDSKFTWTAGLFYAKNHQTENNSIYDPDLAKFTQILAGVPYTDVFVVPLLPGDIDYLVDTRAKDSQRAVFAEGTYDLSDQWKVTLGARYSKTEFDFDVLTAGPQLFGPAQVGGGVQKESSFTPKVNLSYQRDADNLYYFTYAKGFRPGGGNNPIPAVACAADFESFNITNTPLGYNSDSTQSYEVGAKNNIENRVRLASSVYYIKWDGIQQTVGLPTCGISFVSNLGTAVAKGADLQADIALTDAFRVELGVGYTNARFTKDSRFSPNQAKPIASEGDSIEGRDKRPPSPYTGSIGLQYAFNAFEHDAYVRGDYEYQAHAKWVGPSMDPGTLQFSSANFTLPSVAYASLRSGVKFGTWDVAAFIENLTDANPLTTYDFSVNSGTGASRLARYRTLTPRTYGFQVTVRY